MKLSDDQRASCAQKKKEEKKKLIEAAEGVFISDRSRGFVSANNNM